MRQTSNPSRTTRAKPTRKKSATLIRVQYGLCESWSAPPDERWRIVILLASKCVGALLWGLLAGNVSAGPAPARHPQKEQLKDEESRDHASKPKQQRQALTHQPLPPDGQPVLSDEQAMPLSRQPVLFIAKQTLVTLCFEEQTPLLVVSFTDGFLAEFAPDGAWRGVLVKEWRELLKIDMLIGALLEFARERCPHKAAKAASHSLYIHALGFLLAVHLLCANGHRRPGAQSAGLSPEQWEKAQDYIEAHFKEPLRITALYRAAGLGRKRFGRLFKATTGMVPRRYILQRKVAYAQRLLREGHLLRAEIAAEAGFADQSHMGRCLRQFGNEPPL